MDNAPTRDQDNRPKLESHPGFGFEGFHQRFHRAVNLLVRNRDRSIPRKFERPPAVVHLGRTHSLNVSSHPPSIALRLDYEDSRARHGDMVDVPARYEWNVMEDRDTIEHQFLESPPRSLLGPHSADQVDFALEMSAEDRPEPNMRA